MQCGWREASNLNTEFVVPYLLIVIHFFLFTSITIHLSKPSCKSTTLLNKVFLHLLSVLCTIHLQKTTQNDKWLKCDRSGIHLLISDWTLLHFSVFTSFWRRLQKGHSTFVAMNCFRYLITEIESVHVFAIDPNESALKWTFGCEKPLKRVTSVGSVSYRLHHAIWVFPKLFGMLHWIHFVCIRRTFPLAISSDSTHLRNQCSQERKHKTSCGINESS